MPVLVFFRGGEEVLRVEVERSRTVLGRAAQCDVVLPDPEIALEHTALLWDGVEFFREDLARPTAERSEALPPRTRLQSDEEISLGPWTAVVRSDRNSFPSASPGLADARRWNNVGALSRRVRVSALPHPADAGNARRVTASDASNLLPIFVGADPSVRRLTESIERAAASNLLVAIFGERGSGRELVARAVHARSLRATEPFIHVRCGADQDAQLDAEIFGHEAGDPLGAPVGSAVEEAANGTLYLDEVAALSLELQAKLLRSLESGTQFGTGTPQPSKSNVRVIVATSRDLLAAMRSGALREDLYESLCGASLMLQPLRCRRGDIHALAAHFLNSMAPPGQSLSFTAEALALLSKAPWAGNVRELRTVIQEALLRRTGRVLGAADLHFAASPTKDQRSGEFVPGQTLEQMLRQREREIVESALRRFDNNRERVARELGVARSTLFKRLKDWGLIKHETPVPPDA